MSFLTQFFGIISSVNDDDMLLTPTCAFTACDNANTVDRVNTFFFIKL